jgi:hypothetical protein
MTAAAAAAPTTVCACFRHHVPTCDAAGHNVTLLPSELVRIFREAETCL